MHHHALEVFQGRDLIQRDADEQLAKLVIDAGFDARAAGQVDQQRRQVDAGRSRQVHPGREARVDLDQVIHTAVIADQLKLAPTAPVRRCHERAR